MHILRSFMRCVRGSINRHKYHGSLESDPLLFKSKEGYNCSYFNIVRHFLRINHHAPNNAKLNHTPPPLLAQRALMTISFIDDRSFVPTVKVSARFIRVQNIWKIDFHAIFYPFRRFFVCIFVNGGIVTSLIDHRFSAFWLGRLAFVLDGRSKPRADSGPNRPLTSAGQSSGGRAAFQILMHACIALDLTV